MSRIPEAVKYADHIIRNLVKVKPGEEVLIIVDTQTDPEMYQALAAATSAAGAEWTIAMQPSRQPEEGDKLNKAIRKAGEGADVIIGATRSCGAAVYGGVWNDIRNKIRIVSMVMRPLSNMISGGATADRDAMRKVCERLKEVLDPGKEVHLTTERGTDLTLSKEGRLAYMECGDASKPGSGLAFSEGEVWFSPAAGSAEGVVIVDGPMAYVRPVAFAPEPIKLVVKKGRIVSVEGNFPDARKLGELLKTIKNADNIGEFAIGVNPKCIRRGDFEEDKKALGNVHLAFGHFVTEDALARKEEMERYASPIHGDMIIFDAKIEVDGKTILENGELYV